MNEEYGESDGDNGLGERNGRAQNKGTRSTYRVKRRVLWMKKNDEHQQLQHIPEDVRVRRGRVLKCNLYTT